MFYSMYYMLDEVTDNIALMFTVVYYDVQGCTYVMSSFAEYFVNRGKVILLLVEAIGESLFVMVKYF